MINKSVLSRLSSKKNVIGYKKCKGENMFDHKFNLLEKARISKSPKTNRKQEERKEFVKSNKKTLSRKVSEERKELSVNQF